MAESSMKRAAPRATMGVRRSDHFVERCAARGLNAFDDNILEALSGLPGARISVEGYDTSLPEHDIKKALFNHLDSHGEVYDITIPRDPETGLLDRRAFIFVYGHGAEKRVLALNGSRMGGCTLHVMVAPPEEDEVTARYRAFLIKEVEADERCWFGISAEGFDTSLPADLIKSTLIDHFSSCGEITHFFLPTFFDGTTPIGEAHIYFSGQDAEDMALTLDKSVMEGRKLVVRGLPTALNVPHLHCGDSRFGSGCLGSGSGCLASGSDILDCPLPAHTLEMSDEIERKVMALKRLRRMV